MNSLNPNKTQSQVLVAVNSGFFWTNNQPIEFEKKTIKNGIPFIERHKGIILYPRVEISTTQDKKVLVLSKTLWKFKKFAQEQFPDAIIVKNGLVPKK